LWLGKRLQVHFWLGSGLPLHTAAQFVANVRSFRDGYMSRYARAVAKGDSAGLFVQIIRDVSSFSHSVLVELDCLPPVASR
jgi:hypothetical protein